LQTRTWAQQLKIFATSFDIYIIVFRFMPMVPTCALCVNLLIAWRLRTN
jgi:hypothetical protein